MQRTFYVHTPSACSGEFDFEDLLKTKTDAQEFIDNYVKKLGDDGKFLDAELETKYADYLKRKAQEGKMPRDRADWNHARDYWLNDSPMARGNAFNEKAVREGWYAADEVHLANGKRLDSYNTDPAEIISRKATDLNEVQLSTFESYLKEMKQKYSPGTKIRSDKYPDLDGELLEGDMILEIPSSNKTLVNIQDYIDIANNYDIKIRFSPE